jgi:transcriptional regulator with XRE-family HTH domain
MNVIEINIPRRLRDLRKESGYSQLVVADAIGMKRPAYQAYEEGRAIPPLPAIMSLCSFYGFASIDEMLGITIGARNKNEVLDAYYHTDPEKRKIVDFILNLNC